MAEYSKEYLSAVNSSWEADFSYLKELLFVDEGIKVDRICEGFGSVGAILISNEPYLLVLGSNPVKIFDAVEKLRSSHNTSTLDLLN